MGIVLLLAYLFPKTALFVYLAGNLIPPQPPAKLATAEENDRYIFELEARNRAQRHLQTVINLTLKLIGLIFLASIPVLFLFDLINRSI